MENDSTAQLDEYFNQISDQFYYPKIDFILKLNLQWILRINYSLLKVKCPLKIKYVQVCCDIQIAAKYANRPPYLASSMHLALRNGVCAFLTSEETKAEIRLDIHSFIYFSRFFEQKYWWSRTQQTHSVNDLGGTGREGGQIQEKCSRQTREEVKGSKTAHVLGTIKIQIADFRFNPAVLLQCV
jgi:hypothetical protein